jgi:hypothetical protein
MIQDNLVYIQNDILYTDHGECPPNTPSGSSFINPSDETVCVAKPNGHYDVLHVRALSKVHRDPDWIRKLIKKYRPLKLPIFLNTEVFAKIVAECMDKEWQGPLLDLVAEVLKLLQETASMAICNNTTISWFECLTEYLLHKVEQDADTMISEVNHKVLDFIRREKVPYTQNHYLNLSRLGSQQLEDGLREALAPYGNGNVAMSTVSSAITAMFESSQKMSAEEHMAKDMQHALDAYGKVALKRFIDVVPMTCSEVLHNFPTKFSSSLLPISDQELNRLISIPQDAMTQRKNLKIKLDELNQGLQVFEELTRHHTL